MTDIKEFGFGIIGCGMIANFHAQSIKAIPGARLVAVFDRNEDKAQAMAEEHGCEGYGDIDNFLANEDVDIVTIATPSGAHLEPAIASAKAGKHIMCEKPLEVTLERIDQMIAACDENNVTLSGIFPRRFNESTMELKKAIDDGRFGRVTLADAYIKWYRDQAYYDNGAWRGTWALDGGGALMNQSIHTIDLLTHLAGDVVSVCAYADTLTHERIEVEDIAVAILRFKSGALGVVEGSTTCYSTEGISAEIQISGQDGTVFMKDAVFSEWDFRNKTDDDDEIIERLGEKQDEVAMGANDPKKVNTKTFELNFIDVLDSLRKGEYPKINGQEARKAIEIILAIYESAKNGGKEVKL